jgi:hypothetical protein
MSALTFSKVKARLIAKLSEARLGDKVETVAKPIAKVIDKTIKTDLEHCSGCQQRKESLNNLF